MKVALFFSTVVRLVSLMYMGAGTFSIILGVGIKEHDLYHAISDPQQKGFMALVGIGILLFILAFINLCIVN